MTQELINEIRLALPELPLLEGELMSAHCSFRIGGPVDAIAVPSSAEETAALCRLLRQKGVLPLVIGRGTNLLVADGPLHRFVIKIGDRMAELKREGDALTASAGIALSRLASEAAEAGLSGLEFAGGIPGTLGGAIYMNAGAYGGEMKDTVVETYYLDGNLEEKTAFGEEQGFAYRHSAFEASDKIILGAKLRLAPGGREEIRAKMRELNERRRASQPLDLPSAGSTFRRPRSGYAAAMIDEAGLRGCRIGGAMVSEKHAGFVVNAGGATFDDVMELMEHIQETVYKGTGTMLEPEVRIIRG